MGKMKEWIQDHWHEFTHDELLAMGLTDDDIEDLELYFPKTEEDGQLRFDA